jgi:hypothetical protein
VCASKFVGGEQPLVVVCGAWDKVKTEQAKKSNLSTDDWWLVPCSEKVMDGSMHRPKKIMVGKGKSGRFMLHIHFSFVYCN